MQHDLVPELLETIQKDFDTAYGKSKVIAEALAKLKNKSASYETAHDFAVECGRILSEALTSSLNADSLPDGKMYYNIANRLMSDKLGQNYELISGYAKEVQRILNDEAKVRLVPQVPALNQDKIKGLVNRLSNEDKFSKVAWLLGDPIVTFSQGIVDDSIHKNVEFHARAGLSPKIIRNHIGHCCDWCKNLAGVYDYPHVPKDVYRRHGNCRCTVDYRTKDGKIRDVWSKTWRKKQNDDKIEERKRLTPREMSQTRKDALKLGIESNPIKRSIRPKTESQIIKQVGGGDLTKGSCSSLAFAYIGNKAGYNVLDFRDGDSRLLFAINRTIIDVAQLPEVKSHIVSNTNDFIACRQLFAQMEYNKEYYLATGKHVAIIRKQEDFLEYLELQAPFEQNGFKPLTSQTLKERFGCQHSHTRYKQKYDVPNILIEADSLGQNEEFRALLNFINTKEKNQKKGNEGYVR